MDIVAMKVTKDPGATEDGSKPTTVYIGAARPGVDHARNGAPSSHHVLDGYGTDEEITELLDTTELWFVPVANPDGYDFTFEEGQRLWRKNLRDNDGDGAITTEDGVDLNRNLATHWGYDNEGSSPQPSSETFRGPAPGSEPETQAIDGLFARLTPQFLLNYHSAAELLLHGIGWQVATPAPDDVIYEAMLGDDAEPAVPGYDPDISAELYTTNGETDTHARRLTAPSASLPRCRPARRPPPSIPTTLGIRRTAAASSSSPTTRSSSARRSRRTSRWPSRWPHPPHPDEPVSVVGREAEDFRIDSFSVSYGDPQTVAVWAKRALTDVTLHYRVDGGGHDRARAGMGRWRAVRRRDQRLLRRAPRRDLGVATGKHCRGLVHR